MEATAFTKYVYDYLSEEEYLGLQNFLFQYPETGKVVRESSGLRKVRWPIAGKGKSGGVRVIYYFKKQDDEIWLLTIYSKNEVGNIPAHVLRQIAKEIEMTKRDIGQEILHGIREVKDYKSGKKVLRVHSLKEPSPPKVIRQRLKLSQSRCAGLMGVSLRTVQDWEQGGTKQVVLLLHCSALQSKSQIYLSNCHNQIAGSATCTRALPSGNTGVVKVAAKRAAAPAVNGAHSSQAAGK